MDSGAKNYLCTAFRQAMMIANARQTGRMPEDRPVFPDLETAEHFAEDFFDDGSKGAPTVLWRFNYDDLDAVQGCHWTVKRRSEFE